MTQFSNEDAITITLRDYIDNQLIAYGSPNYSYLVINKKNPLEMLCVSNYPQEWREIYVSNNYQNIDPVVLSSFKRFSPFSWDENITILSDIKSSNIFSISRKYNIINGLTFVLHDHMNNLAMLSLVMDNSLNAGAEEKMMNSKDKLQMLLIKIHEKMHIFSEQRKKRAPDRIGKPIFSPRENEVIYWASMGKTYQEIAHIAGITPRTVKFHMGNVVRKLGVINARQAIRLSTELELIRPVQV